MVQVVKYEPEHLMAFDFSGLSEEFKGAMQERQRLMEMAQRGAVYSVLLDGRVIFVGGLCLLWTGVAEAWCLLLPEAAEHFKLIHRKTKELFAAFLGNGGRRIQTSVQKGFFRGWHWVEHLGMKPEGEMPMYGPDGQDYVRFAIVKGG